MRYLLKRHHSSLTVAYDGRAAERDRAVEPGAYSWIGPSLISIAEVCPYASVFFSGLA